MRKNTKAMRLLAYYVHGLRILHRNAQLRVIKSVKVSRWFDVWKLEDNPGRLGINNFSRVGYLARFNWYAVVNCVPDYSRPIWQSYRSVNVVSIAYHK